MFHSFYFQVIARRYRRRRSCYVFFFSDINSIHLRPFSISCHGVLQNAQTFNFIPKSVKKKWKFVTTNIKCQLANGFIWCFISFLIFFGDFVFHSHFLFVVLLFTSVKWNFHQLFFTFDYYRCENRIDVMFYKRCSMFRFRSFSIHSHEWACQ